MKIQKETILNIGDTIYYVDKAHISFYKVQDITYMAGIDDIKYSVIPLPNIFKEGDRQEYILESRLDIETEWGSYWTKNLDHVVEYIISTYESKSN